MRFQWTNPIVSVLAGFSGACIVQLLSLQWQEGKQKKLLRKSLYVELVNIYISLRELLPHLENTGGDNPANLPVLVKAECFNAAKSSPVFWRLQDAVGIVKAHEHLGILALFKAHDCHSAAIEVTRALTMFRSGKLLCLRDLRTALRTQEKGTLDKTLNGQAG